MPGAVLGTLDIAVNKTKISIVMELTFFKEDIKKAEKKCKRIIFKKVKKRDAFSEQVDTRAKDLKKMRGSRKGHLSVPVSRASLGLGLSDASRPCLVRLYIVLPLLMHTYHSSLLGRVGLQCPQEADRAWELQVFLIHVVFQISDREQLPQKYEVSRCSPALRGSQAVRIAGQGPTGEKQCE